MNNDNALDALIAKAKRHDAPPEHAEQDAWAGFVGALGGGGGGGGGGEDTGPAPTPTSEALTKGPSALGLGKVVAALAVVGAVGAGVAQWTQPDPPPRVEAPIETSTPTQHPPSAAGVAAPLPAVTPAPTAVPEASTVTATPPIAGVQRPRVSPRPAAPEVPVSASTLAEEARLVGSMWKAIDRGDAKAALPLAAQHRARFPEGELRLEAQAAGVAARCILGRAINLTELQALRRGASTSVANRLTAACGESE